MVWLRAAQAPCLARRGWLGRADVLEFACKVLHSPDLHAVFALTGRRLDAEAVGKHCCKWLARVHFAVRCEQVCIKTGRAALASWKSYNAQPNKSMHQNMWRTA